MNETPEEVEHANYQAWLSNLKPGDEFLIQTRWVEKCHIDTVVRVTATQIISKGQYGNERRYRRADGRPVGGRGSDRIEPATDDARTLQLFDEKIVLVRLVRNISHRSDVLEDISFTRCIMASNSLGFQALLSNSDARSLDDADHKMIFRMLFDTPGDHGIEHSFL